MTLPPEIREAARWNPAAQFEGFQKIVNKGGEVIRPIANVHQMRINEVVVAAHRMRKPCRIIGLKPRQKGSSTFSVQVGHTRLKAKLGRGLIAGGKHFQGQNLFRMLDTYAKHDELDASPCKVLDMEARYKTGSTMQRITLANGDAGRSGTYQFLCVTEAAYLAEEGVANADAVLDGLLKCVAYEADTIIIVESTANGAAGYFYDMWQGAITVEEFMAGKNGYVRIFSAWFEFEDSRMDPAGEGIASRDDLRADELAYEADIGRELDLEQFAWMRWALRDECKGDWDKFKQDYPSDPETAFLRSGRGVFDQTSLKWQETVVKKSPREFGGLSYNERSDKMVWTGCGEREAMLVRWETPRRGCRYLVVIDPMTGEDQTGGDDPDSHGVFVLRDGYMQGGRWVEPAVVMRNMMVPANKPGSLCCWWAIDVLEEQVWRMARYWQAVVVPEMNMDRGLVELLKQRGDVDIYEREMFNRRDQVMTKALGWMTDKRTRGMVVDGLVGRIRASGNGEIGGGLEVRCPWAVAQMRDFIRKPSGRCEAMGGKHDDDILALGIAMQCLERATPWYEVERVGWEPGGGVVERCGGGAYSV